MYPIPPRILFLFLFFSSLVAASNFTQCLVDFQNNTNPNAVGGVDSKGQPTSPAEAAGLTYETCTALCGPGAESFNWREFAQLFSSWLLPWLALISQLPFGSGDRADDFISVVLSVGSPALSAYSLVLTSLNARLVYRRVKRVDHGRNRNALARALISLQQTPLELTKNPKLLKFIPINDHWSQEIHDRLNRRNAWSVATASSVAWVVIAFLFTLVDSFVSLNDTTDAPSEGQAVGTLWLWLLCLVIGWLWVPTFTRGELKSAIGHANWRAVKKAAKLKRKARNAYKLAKTKVTHGLSKGMPILKVHKPRPADSPLPGADEDNEKVKSESGSIQEDTRPAGLSPLPDPTHHISTVSFQLPAGSQPDHGHSVGANPAANQSNASVQSSIRPGEDKLLNHKDLGWLNQDERRLAATFNYSRVIRYLVLVDDVLRALDNIAHEKGEKRTPSVASSRTEEGDVFPEDVFISMLKAFIAALILQCGTTAAAIVIVVFTPTVGLGCRSMGYAIYGGSAILILFLTIISTISARISETRSDRSFIVKRFTAFIAITLRWLCLLLALINAAGLIVLSCFQFSNFLDNCYCNGSVTGRGVNSYIIISTQGWISTMRTARIAATALAGATMAIYMFYLWFMSALPAEVDDW